MLQETRNLFSCYFLDMQGRRQGEYKSWYNNGQAERHCFYLNDMLHGEHKMWFENGQIREHSFLIDGNYHGEFKEWHENGQPSRHCFAVNNKRHGEYKSWDKDGRLRDHCFFVNDREKSFEEIPYPTTPEECMLFTLKYNLQLLPDTIASCVIIAASKQIEE